MHVHSERLGSERLKEASGITLAGGISNAILAAGKIAVGFIFGYLPLTASGFHSLSDIVSDAVTWFTLMLGSRDADCRFHYGYRKVETLMSLVAAIFLVFVSVELITDSFYGHKHGHGHTISAPIHDHPNTPVVDKHHQEEGGAEDVALEEAGVERHERKHHYSLSVLILVAIVAMISIMVKEALFQLTHRKGIALNSPMLIAKAWHHRADCVSSIAVLTSVFITFFFPEFKLVDQITTIIIAGLILHSGWVVGVTAVKELIDYAPSLKTTALIEEITDNMAEISFTHGVRVRTMGGALCIELIAETDPDCTVAQGYAIAGKIKEEVTTKIPNVIDVTTIITPKGEYLRSFMG